MINCALNSAILPNISSNGLVKCSHYPFTEQRKGWNN